MHLKFCIIWAIFSKVVQILQLTKNVAYTTLFDLAA